MCSICNELKEIIYCLVFPINLKLEQGRNPGGIRVQGYSCNEIKILLIIIKLGYHEYMCWVSWNFNTSSDSLLHGSAVDCLLKNITPQCRCIKKFLRSISLKCVDKTYLIKKGAVFIPLRSGAFNFDFFQPKTFRI